MNTHQQQVESLLGDLDSIRSKDISIEEGMAQIDWKLDNLFAHGNKYASRVEKILKESGCHPNHLKVTDFPSDDYFPASQELRKIIYS